jgi:hypothetical protein
MATRALANRRLQPLGHSCAQPRAEPVYLPNAPRGSCEGYDRQGRSGCDAGAKNVFGFKRRAPYQNIRPTKLHGFSTDFGAEFCLCMPFRAE